MAHRAKHRAAVRRAAGDRPARPEALPREPRGGHGPGQLEEMILAGLQHQPHVYQGTVDPVTVAERRARNKRARKSRRRARLADAHAIAWLLVASSIIGAAGYYSAIPT